MFLKADYTVASTPSSADIICFTGGEDVSPMLYDEVKLKQTTCDHHRDQKCCDLFNTYVGKKKMLGICRGAQFLNVMNGGALYQDVDNHTCPHGHLATVVSDGSEIKVTSTHHQMMIATGEAELLLVANESSFKYPTELSKEDPWVDVDVEALFYEETMSLCFQPHPEYERDGGECQELFFEFVEQYLM
ncbi:MAG: hypothetical protein CMN30_31850 [Sandaracinus sp.]|nr:hypothetical protein [Sandaracinus sp.]